MAFQVGGMMSHVMDSYYQQSDSKKKTDKKDSFDKDMKDKLQNKDQGVVFEKQNHINKIHKTNNTEVELSDRAKKLLEELKEKYSNMEFFIANAETDEEADAIMSKGRKEYSVLIDPETLEKMAADEEFKEKSLETLESSIKDMDSVFEELGEDADKIESVSIRINSDGSVDFFAKLKEATDKQKEIQSEKLKEKKEKEKSDEKKADEKKRQEYLSKKAVEKYQKMNPGHWMNKNDKVSNDKSTVVHASSAQELIDMIRNTNINA